MNRSESSRSNSINRRIFLANFATTAAVTTAGCGNASEGDSNENEDVDAGEDSPVPEDFEALQAELGSVFDEIESLPIVDEDKLVFDVSAFEKEFAHDELLERIETVHRRVESVDDERISRTEHEDLSDGADMAELLVRERILVHQTIAAGLTYERRVLQSEYETATEAIRHARTTLDYLVENGKQLEAHPWYDRRKDVTAHGFQPDSVRNTQDVLARISIWTDSAYEGFHEFGKGLSRFVTGNDALKGNRYADAGDSYDDASKHLEDAKVAFDRAHGSGRRLPHLVPTFEEVRCMIPAYTTASEELHDSMAAFEVGDETRGREIAREAFDTTEKKLARCP